MKKYRAWAEINLSAFERNIKAIKHYIGNNVKILVVLKADAYGHGAVPIAHSAIEAGADMIGVGDSEEAIELRKAGVLSPILILGAIIEEEIGWVVSYDITPTLHSLYMFNLLESEAKRQNKILKVHLKVDTGMSRLGASPQQAIELAKKIYQSPYLRLEGLSTHLSSAHIKDDEFTKNQITLFKNVIADLKKENISIPLIHAANSAATLFYKYSIFNMVRLGYSLFGLDTNFNNSQVKFEPILTLKTQIAFLKTVKQGTPVGYGHTFYTNRESKLATIPIGYNDGYPYQLSNKGKVIIRGQYAPVVGSVTMDYIIVDCTDIPEVSVGDEVVLYGKCGNKSITVKDVADLTATIPYEITCRLGRRVKRVYTRI